MKKLLFIIAICFSFSTIYGQVKVLEVTHYIFPEFTKGTVLMKTGVRNEALLNYNSLTEEMIFDTKGKKLAMAQLDQVDTVYIGNRKFFLYNNKFVELLHKSKYELYVEHKCSVKDPGKPSAYDGTSQTSATTTYSSYLSGGQVYELKLPEGVETKPYTEFWFKKDGKTTKFLSIRQLMKQFEDKEDDFKEFAKENNVKYENQASVVALVKFMETK
ncbi:MAG: hypothetical protein JNK09_20405 [Prolixibacteraceae bacterium]|nr:hypothetical protein [Prolixibacteraceae bacterium]